ncbi:hypothetical protein APTSU1_001675000 [Apodemus speciosus]|uniref:Prolactin receptor n=1 Tax=Apodemus speciosus TaxID=105296 RepID=A0ABQ0FQI8_APOSI
MSKGRQLIHLGKQDLVGLTKAKEGNLSTDSKGACGAGEHVESPGVRVPGAMRCFPWMLPRELGALQEQPMLRADEPSFQPPNKNLKSPLNIQSGVGEVQVENDRDFSLPSHPRKEKSRQPPR